MANNNFGLIAFIGLFAGSSSEWMQTRPHLESTAICNLCRQHIPVYSHYRPEIVNMIIQHVPIKWERKQDFKKQVIYLTTSPTKDHMVGRFGLHNSTRLAFCQDLFQCAINDSKKLEHLLQNITHKNDVNVQDVYGDTALHIATRKNNYSSIKVLRDFGANDMIVNMKGIAVSDMQVNAPPPSYS